MAQTKATKKFEKKHLKDVLKRRKEHAKVKQKIQMKEKRKVRKAANATDDGEETTKPKANGAEKAFNEMSVDDFFQGGFDVPEDPKAKRKAVKPKTGKRKRTEPVEEDEASSSDESTVKAGVEEVDGPGSAYEEESGDELQDHKAQIDALAEKDPEFYKFLQENDAELLDFPADADLEAIDGLSEDEEEAPQAKKRKTAKADESDAEDAEGGNEVTKALTDKWSKSMADQNSLRAMREVIIAFRAAVHANDDETKSYKYSVTNARVYDDLLKIALQQVPTVLEHHLPVKEHPSGRIRLATDSKKYRTLSPLFKTHATSILYLLSKLSDPQTLGLTLSSLVPLLTYILSFKKLIRDLARDVVGIWADTTNSDAVRISAFLVLRRLVLIGDPSIKEGVLKTTYQGLVKGSRNTTIHTLSAVNLMKNSAAELWGLDSNIGYTTGFVFIRQLAIHLRSSITNPTKDSYKTIYNWQYVHSLDFWSRALHAHCDALREAEAGKESPLRPLIYPVVQITLGALRLIPTAQYFPLRFQLIRSLLRLSRATGTYIPLAPALYEVLNSAEMKKPPKSSTLKPLDFSTSIRGGKSYIRTRVYQDGVGEQVAELLSEFFVLWCKSIAFPELALPVIVLLKRWLKEVSSRSSGNKNTKVNSMIVLLVQKLEANLKWIEERRVKVDFAPNDRAGVEGFLKDIEWEKTPIGAFVVGQRKNREEKAKIVEEARRQDEERRKRDKEEEDQEMMEDGFEDEEESDENVSEDEDEE